jgi:hypothetical protein
MTREISMKLDRYTARALVDADLMSLREYIDAFGSVEEMNAGKADTFEVRRVKAERLPISEGESKHGFPRPTPRAATIRSHCH